MIALLLFSFCNTDKLKPIFEGLKHVSVDNVTKKNISVSADLIFYNPNIFSIELTDLELDVFINGIEVANIKQVNKVEINGKQYFDYPTNISFNPQQTFKNDIVGFLNTFGSIYKNKELKLSYVGDVSFNVKGLALKLPINFKDKVKF